MKLERTHRHFSKQVRIKVRMLAVKSAITQLDLVNGQYVAPTPEIVSMIHADVILEVGHYVFSSRARARARASTRTQSNKHTPFKNLIPLSYALARFLSLLYQLDEETDAYLCPQIGWQQRLMAAERLQHWAQSEQDVQALLLERRQAAQVFKRR
jgi:hypothetical protein